MDTVQSLTVSCPALASPYHLYVVPEDFLFLQYHRGFVTHSDQAGL